MPPTIDIYSINMTSQRPTTQRHAIQKRDKKDEKKKVRIPILILAKITLINCREKKMI